MTENIDHASASGGSTKDTDRAAVALERRRRFLAGGLATGAIIVTLPSRSALADGGKVCTISTALTSLNPSSTAAGPCGDSPGCWRNHGYDVWSATNPINPGPINHDTPISSILTALGSLPFLSLNASPSWTCANLINATGQTPPKITVKLSSSSNYTFSFGIQQNIIGALLNAQFYGAKYHGPTSSDINYVMTQIAGIASGPDTDKQKTNGIDALLNSLGTQFQQNIINENCPG